MPVADVVRDHLAKFTRTCIVKGGWRLAPHLNRMFEPTTATVRLPDVGLCQLDLRDEDLLRIYWSGLEREEREVMRLTRELLPPNGVYCDLGANIGFQTLSASRHLQAGGGQVLAFEPHPSNFEFLSANVALNGLHNVRLEPLGLSDAPGKLRVQGSDVPGNWSVASHGAHEFEIELVRLDDYLERHPVARIDLVKMDIEGSEVRALRGARQTLRTFRPALIFEANPSWLRRMGTSIGELFQTIHELDYTIHPLPRRLADLKPALPVANAAAIDADAWPNLLALPRRA